VSGGLISGWHRNRTITSRLPDDPGFRFSLDHGSFVRFVPSPGCGELFSFDGHCPADQISFPPWRTNWKQRLGRQNLGGGGGGGGGGRRSPSPFANKGIRSIVESASVSTGGRVAPKDRLDAGRKVFQGGLRRNWGKTRPAETERGKRRKETNRDSRLAREVNRKWPVSQESPSSQGRH